MLPLLHPRLCDAFFRIRTVLALALCLTGLLFGVSAFTAVASNTGARSRADLKALPPGKLAKWVTDHTANGQTAEFLVLLIDQADLTEARSAKTKHERGRRVRDELWNKAQQTHRPILQWLRQHHIEHRPFYIVNAIWVKADAETAATLAARGDVLQIEGNPEIQNQIINPPVTETTPSATDSTTAVETGITYSHAPQVWALGYTGQGIVVGGADTGYRWTHQALKNHYRGWDGATADHDYNWHDSVHTNGGITCGHDSTVPCDDDNHGSHTMGTAVGSDGANNQIGMAPGAKWIGCRNMDRGKGTPARYIECMEFFLAPYPVGGTPAQGDPTKAPDITTNSWGCPQSEGCAVNTLQAAVEAQRAAGIFMVVAAGNYGSGCNTVLDPPGTYDAVYSIGALNTGSDTIADFSSRGSVTAGGSSRMKPDLSAPGNPVRSSTAGTNSSYNSFSGTSMATPHVAGATALLWSAQPLLRNDIEATEAILNESAVPLLSGQCDAGFASPNNVFGFGRLDIKAAVDTALLVAPTRTSISTTNGAFTVRFSAGMNRTYRLEQTSNASFPNWTAVLGANDFASSADGPAQLTDPHPVNTPTFYRVRLVNYGAR